MSLAIPPIAGGPPPAATPPTPAPTSPPTAGQPRAVDRVELSPSAEARRAGETQTASGRAIELAAQNRELHFSRDADSGHIVVEVRTLDGELIRTIPRSEAIEILAARALW